MEAAARHVLSEDSIPDTCKNILATYPVGAIDLAMNAGGPLALLSLIGSGEVHVVDRLVQAKVLNDSILEQPNAVFSQDPQVQNLLKEVARTGEFLAANMEAALRMILAVIKETNFKAEVVKNNKYTGPEQIKSLWKLLKSWKAFVGWSGGLVARTVLLLTL